MTIFELDDFIKRYDRLIVMAALAAAVEAHRKELTIGFTIDLIPTRPFKADWRVSVCWRNPGHKEFCEDTHIRTKLGGRTDPEFIQGLIDTLEARRRLKGVEV